MNMHMDMHMHMHIHINLHFMWVHNQDKRVHTCATHTITDLGLLLVHLTNMAFPGTYFANNNSAVVIRESTRMSPTRMGGIE